MAEFRSFAQFQGPNEELAAEKLQANLPEDWWVIANRQLDTNNHEDIDFFVLGKNNLFLIEEKSWGPKILVGDLKWTVINSRGNVSERKSPFRNVVPKAKITAGWLREKIPGYKNTKDKRVVEVVLLTHPKLELTTNIGYKITGNLVSLEDICSFLLKYDVENNDGVFSNLRNSIVALLLDTNIRKINIPKIENFKITREIEFSQLDFPMNRMRKFEAEDEMLNQEFHLNCLIINPEYIEQEAEWTDFAIRDFTASEKLNSTERAWKQTQPFRSFENDYLVLPFKKPDGAISLFELSNPENLEIAKVYFNNIESLVEDALIGLQTIHGTGIIHRNINPENTWIVRGARIIFNDFVSSHIDNQQTITGFVKPNINNIFAAPELSQNVFAATSKSDLYSLAKSFLWWVERMCNSNSEFAIGTQLKGLLENCSLPDSNARINIDDAILSLGKINNKSVGIIDDENDSEIPDLPDDYLPTDFPPEFKLLKRLGSGSTGISYLAEWKQEDDEKSLVVLKHARNKKAVKRLVDELLASQQLKDVDFCARGLDKRDNPSPGFIVSTYLPGESLNIYLIESKINYENLAKLFIGTVEILKKLHERKLVHGDISPANIVIDDENAQPQLIDFGTLRNFGKYEKPFGTPRFYAPEIPYCLEVNESSDYYSLAATFIYLVLGRHHRTVGLGDTEAGFKVDPLLDEEKLQFPDEICEFVEILFKLVNPEKSARTPIDEVLEEILKIDSREITVVNIDTASPKINIFVPLIRSLFTGSKHTSKGAVAERITTELDKKLLTSTYVDTKLDTHLLPRVKKGDFKVLLLTGNPGGGKTAFLQTIKEFLIQSDGKLISQNHASNTPEWLIESNGKKFRAILDASQSQGEREANEIILNALNAASKGDEIALIAVNDGKLKQFLRLYGEDFTELNQVVNDYFNNLPVPYDDYLVVDLKKRSVVDLELSGFVKANIDKLTDDSLWKECTNCVYNNICPIFANKNNLRNEVVAEKLSELTLSTHLKRTELPNFRRIRSAISYLITADLDCNIVADKVINNDLHFEKYQISNLVFEGNSGDSLIDGWASIDPAKRISPKVRNKIAYMPRDISFSGEIEYASHARQTFLGLRKDEFGEIESEVSTYKYSEVFYEYLSGRNINLEPILHGISRIGGQRFPYSKGMLVAESNSNSGWSVMKLIPENQFRLSTPKIESPYLETINDNLILIHESAHKLILDLNSFELIMRLASGEIFNDFASASIRYDIEAFAAKILRNPQESIAILDAGGNIHKVRILDKTLQLTEEIL